MGWFNAVMAVWGDNPTFSSPLGDGLVQEGDYVYFIQIGFSSPSRDGLVLSYDWDDDQKAKIFVPEWGWVGSLLFDESVMSFAFSSPLGDGLVPNFMS